MSGPVIPVVLSGGAGSRLWPLSDRRRPKQYIVPAGGQSLLQATVRRLAAVNGLRPPIIVCNEWHRSLAAEQFRAVGMTPAVTILEPVARNTAPAIAAAALESLAQSNGAEPVLLVLPADHVIRDEARFAAAVQIAVQEAAAGRLATFGVVPTRVDTGFGYMVAGDSDGMSGEARRVDAFVEKPDARRAADLIETGDCYWNSGMFAFGANVFLRELGTHAATIRDAVGEAHRYATREDDHVRLEPGAFGRSPAVSVDRAVMENTDAAVVVPLDAGWSDVGSWTSVAELAERDEAGNTVQGAALLEGTRNAYIRAGSRLVAAVGLTDCVIVDTDDAVLIADRKASQQVGKIAERLEMAGHAEQRWRGRVQRPWGCYDVLADGAGFKVKRITVDPGQRISLQSHRYRSEHWIVMSGTARATVDSETFTVTENGSVFIPRGTWHRLQNPTTAPLEIVEVQLGDYLEEDDIIRIADDYGRVAPEHTSDRTTDSPCNGV